MPNELRIVATAPVPAVARDAFAGLGEIAILDAARPQALAQADVLVARAERIDERLLDGAGGLRVIARTGAGLDTVDVQAVTRRGIPLLYAPEAGTLAMAEGTLTLILACMKRLRELGGIVAEGRWNSRYETDVLDIAGTKLGIVGFGRIGREVARLAHALGMEVVAYDPRPEAFRASPVEVSARSLTDVFSHADVITLHCPLNAMTEELVDVELIAMARAGAILVNASRGGLVAGDQVLLDALEAGRLSAVGLDVFRREPASPSSRLLNDPRVISTPHAIGLTRSWNRSVFGTLARDVARVLAGERPTHLANPEVLEASPRAADG